MIEVFPPFYPYFWLSLSSLSLHIATPATWHHPLKPPPPSPYTVVAPSRWPPSSPNTVLHHLRQLSVVVTTTVEQHQPQRATSTSTTTARHPLPPPQPDTLHYCYHRPASTAATIAWYTLLPSATYICHLTLFDTIATTVEKPSQLPLWQPPSPSRHLRSSPPWETFTIVIA